MQKTMVLNSYQELDVWKVAIDMVAEVYRATRTWPLDERFGLTAQIRRAAVSVPANIAEGYGRTHRGDYLRFFSIARGSVAEVETHLIIAARVEIATRDALRPAWELLQRVGQMLTAQVRSLETASSSRDPKPETRDPISEEAP